MTTSIEIISSENKKSAKYYTLKLNETTMKIYTAYYEGIKGVWLQGGGIFCNMNNEMYISKWANNTAVKVALTEDQKAIMSYAKNNL
jgi:hypothetical protein